MQENQLFDFVENCFNKQTPIASSFQFKEVYMAIKFLSLHPSSFLDAVEANRLSMNLPDWATCMFLFHSVPKGRAPKIIYPKKNKSEEWPKELVEKVVEHFLCSSDHAIQILSILKKQNPSAIESMGVEVKNGRNIKVPKSRSKKR